MKWYLLALKRYAEFSGRSTRNEFWFFVLFNVLISLGLTIVGELLGAYIGGFGFLQGIYSLATLVPTFAVCVRRLHDTGRSGFWILVGLIPFIGSIILLIFYCQGSQESGNQYGPSPATGDYL